MQKIKMSRGTLLTFEEGCNKYLENCRQRNLREGTINHYRQSYLYFYKFFDPKMPIEDIDEQTYKDYVLHLKKTLNNDITRRKVKYHRPCKAIPQKLFSASRRVLIFWAGYVKIYLYAPQSAGI